MIQYKTILTRNYKMNRLDSGAGGPMRVQRRQSLWRCSVLVLLAGSLASGPVAAQERAQGTPKSVVVQPNEQLDDVQLKLWFQAKKKDNDGGSVSAPVVDRPQFEVGTRVILCFSASEDGYVRISTADGEGVTDIYPYPPTPENDDPPPPVGMPIKGGKKQCIGDKDGKKITVTSKSIRDKNRVFRDKNRVYLEYARKMEYLTTQKDSVNPGSTRSTRSIVATSSVKTKYLDFDAVKK